MTSMQRSLLILLVCVLFSAPAQEDLLVPTEKIGFDPARIGDDGLYGPPDGLRAMDYELCIPAAAEEMEEVAAIDASVRFYSRARGRVGCRVDQVLVLGNTHQLGFRDVLSALAELPYVERIEPAWFE